MASERHEEEQAEKAFTVSDKRLFTREGARRDPDTPRETPGAGSPPPPPPPRREAPRAAEPQRTASRAGGWRHAVTCRQPILPCW